MNLYKYKATGPDKKVVSGLVEADSDDAAIEILRDRGLEIIGLDNQGKAKLKFDFNRFFARIKPKDLVIFSRQFSVLVSANVAMVQALRVMVEQTENPKLKVVVSEIREEIDGGSSLSEALAKRPKIFDNFFTNVIKSGESSGKLDEVLNYLADEMEKDYDMMSKIKGAMVYPAFIFTLLIGVGVFMMIAVVPKMTAMLTETGAELPLPTKILIAVSGFLSKDWWLLLIIIVGTVIGLRKYIQTPQGRAYKDIILLKLPIFGLLLQRIYLVRFTRSLNVLLVGGVNLTKGLRIVSEIVSNTVYQDLINRTIKEVEEGNSISTVFLNSPYIPKMVAQMLAIGEKTGKIDVILEKITSFYGREISNIVASLMTLMEPIIMVIMGLGVATMVAAIIMPMLNVSQSI